MQIRTIGAGDIDAAKAVQGAAFAGNRAVYRPKATARSVFGGGDPEVTRLVAVEGGAVIGVTCFWMQDGECHLGAVAVKPSQRGRGVARALIEYIEGVCRSRAVGVMVASTIRQAGQVGFYERLGFTAAEEREPSWAEPATGQPISEVELRKLTQPST